MVTVVANHKGGAGKTTTEANVGALFARRGRRVLIVDTDPQFALTRQLGLEARSLGVNLVDVLAGRAGAADAIVRGVHGVDVIPAAGELAGVEMSLVGELGRRAVPPRRARVRRRRLRRGSHRHAAEPRGC
jgi:chromosome partitioning protein